MKREILFKAKREDNDEWVEGFYVCISGTKHYILTGNPVISPHNVDIELYKIIPETVGLWISSRSFRMRESVQMALRR